MITIYEDLNIVEAASQAGFNTLLKAAKAAGLDEALESAEDITVFAPDEEAFDRIEESVLEELLKPENKEKLGEILKYHVVSTIMPADAVQSVDSIEMINGQKTEIFKRNGTLMINGAEITAPDIKVQNGIIHKINRVLLPE